MQSKQVRKDTEGHFGGSEDVLNLVRSSVTEASLVNETNEQVFFQLIIISKVGMKFVHDDESKIEYFILVRR